MKFIVMGVNHKLMDIDERKSYSFRDSDKLSFSTQLEDDADQILILSTCNRSEVYVVVDDSFDENRLKTAYFSYFDQKDDRYVLYTNQEALLYLLEVACGLQSMVVGEDQILHQIKEALTWAMSQHFSGKEMNYIFQTVIKFAKEMKNKYAVSEHPLSLSYIGYQHLRKMLKLEDKIMICGIGEMAQLMIEYLKDHELYIVNRTYEKVVPFLNEKRHYVAFEDRYHYLDKVNAIVCATAAPHSIFEHGKVNVSHPLVFVDLAIPRDVDKELESDSIQVIDMDILKTVSDHHLKMRKQICQSIEKECVEYVKVIDNELKNDEE